MKPSNSYKEVQKLIGCLAVLNRFISKSGERNLPFFKNLRRTSMENFVWDEECKVAFQELKSYFGSPQLLSRPEPGERLQVYLAISDVAVKVMNRIMFKGIKNSILQSEVGLPTDMRIGFEEESNDQRLKEYLKFVDELRDEAVYKTLKYKQLMARSYNRRVKNCQFHSGDLVLRLCSASQPKKQSKLSPKWEGHYRVKRIVGPSTYELEDLDGKAVPRTWHASKLCKCYE
ncbi:hypothetical protein LIER_41782 [Lithospermum erythrorhizon]|uniref:Uncharacterized protein n=1 Tax=Lithospermum erythrorhizon TaxID=34254 RepID=A0AAV3RI40_LITER